ncbi:hypothetical protein E2C01_085894 [Portunus trituberculatus]|uniref:Uncharacterized protein n=1 Tax=Portunus trituberculatus TaxID=210409 RepID=A0A5B7J290_PORTR|nr:hypothetical protein [Portunus trituberculatus]
MSSGGIYFFNQCVNRETEERVALEDSVWAGLGETKRVRLDGGKLGCWGVSRRLIGVYRPSPVYRTTAQPRAHYLGNIPALILGHLSCKGRRNRRMKEKEEK